MKTKHYNIQEKSFLLFELGKELFAVQIENVIEALRDPLITDVPRTDDFIEGIIHFRGEIVSIIDLKKKIKLREQTNKKSTNTIIVFEFEDDEEQVKIGVKVDKVNKVTLIKETDIEPIPEFGSAYNPEYLKGTFLANKKFAMILEIKKVLETKEVELIKNITEA